MMRTQISLDPEEHRLARRRAHELGISLAEYLRRLLRRDLEEPNEPPGDISVIFGLGNSGGSDIAANKDTYVGEAVAARRNRA